eukprot:8727392-Pyramimonas_sp.AAC.1
MSPSMPESEPKSAWQNALSRPAATWRVLQRRHGLGAVQWCELRNETRTRRGRRKTQTRRRRGARLETQHEADLSETRTKFSPQQSPMVSSRANGSDRSLP